MIQELMPFALLLMSLAISVIGFFMKRMIATLDRLENEIRKMDVAYNTLNLHAITLDRLKQKVEKLKDELHELQLQIAKCQASNCKYD